MGYVYNAQSNTSASLACLPAPLTCMLERPLASVQCAQQAQNIEMLHTQRTSHLSPYPYFLAKAAPEHAPNCRQGQVTSEQTNADSNCETIQIQGLRARFQLGIGKPTTTNTQAKHTLLNQSGTLAHTHITHFSFTLSPRYTYSLAMLGSLRLSWLWLLSYVWIMVLLFPERVWEHSIQAKMWFLSTKCIQSWLIENAKDIEELFQIKVVWAHFKIECKLS